MPLTVFLWKVEGGLILYAAAPSSAAFIVGRVISGAGAAGLLCGSLAIYGRSVPLQARLFGMALVTSIYGIAEVLGLTLGGLITDTPKLSDSASGMHPLHLVPLDYLSHLIIETCLL